MTFNGRAGSPPRWFTRFSMDATLVRRRMRPAAAVSAGTKITPIEAVDIRHWTGAREALTARHDDLDEDARLRLSQDPHRRSVFGHAAVAGETTVPDQGPGAGSSRAAAAAIPALAGGRPAVPLASASSPRDQGVFCRPAEAQDHRRRQWNKIGSAWRQPGSRERWSVGEKLSHAV
jgi:hypothetical protein